MKRNKMPQSSNVTMPRNLEEESSPKKKQKHGKQNSGKQQN